MKYTYINLLCLVNYQEFEVQKYEDLYNEGNSVYVCVTVLLHALLKCTDNKFRNQLSERMNNEEQVLLATFLGATQSVSFTKKNISEALLLLNDTKDPTANVSGEINKVLGFIFFKF